MTRDRIKGHVRVRAGDLLAHPDNPRTHSDAQREALAALYEEVGACRSLLAYEVPSADGGAPRLRLIDGHLRQSMSPDQVVDVEVLDVGEGEAAVLLLSLDPIGALAGGDVGTLELLQASVGTESEALASLWALAQRHAGGGPPGGGLDRGTKPKKGTAAPKEQFVVLVECAGESEQVALLSRLKSEGLDVQAKVY